MGKCLGKLRRDPKDKILETSEYSSVPGKPQQRQESPVRYTQQEEVKSEPVRQAPVQTVSSPVVSEKKVEKVEKVVDKRPGATVFFESVLTEGDQASRMIQYQDSWEAVANALDLDVEDPALLVFSYEVCSSDPSTDIQQLTITETAWNRYSSSLRITSANDLKKQIPTWRAALRDIKSKKFRQIYEFAFTFIRDQSVRNLPADDAVMYWQLLFDNKWSHLPTWIQFVETSNKKVISRDEWCVLLDLAKDDTAIETYDTDSSWPLLIDDFMGYIQKNKSG
eukprot:TRINITY_DN1792_c0_g1_i1.p1 TRINITY_DN1792_c0_g1~~TRINITY_DN1792_c0_g1_i1.p1  ORF type:complete len:280 (+),score=63.24 TRINITY_DN1792_c0_g1_i1:128-967(+)